MFIRWDLDQHPDSKFDMCDTTSARVLRADACCRRHNRTRDEMNLTKAEEGKWSNIDRKLGFDEFKKQCLFSDPASPLYKNLSVFEDDLTPEYWRKDGK